MAKPARPQAAPALPGTEPHQPPCGTVRSCLPYAGELARHRVITADGADFVVATVHEPRRTPAYLTGAYPVVRGYLVMVRQPLHEVRSSSPEESRWEHEQLVRVLAEAGVKLVRARRTLAARQRAERSESTRTAKARSARAATDIGAFERAVGANLPPTELAPASLTAMGDGDAVVAFG